LAVHAIMAAPTKPDDHSSGPRSLGSVLAAWLGWTLHGSAEAGSDGWAISPGRWPSEGEAESGRTDKLDRDQGG
jgi:hypothetical protein